MCSQSCWQYNSGVKKIREHRTKRRPPSFVMAAAHALPPPESRCTTSRARAFPETPPPRTATGCARSCRSMAGRWQVDGRSMWRGSTRYTTRPVDARPTLGLHDLSMSADARSFYCASIYLSIYLSIYPSIHPSIYPSIYLSIYLSI